MLSVSSSANVQYAVLGFNYFSLTDAGSKAVAEQGNRAVNQDLLNFKIERVNESRNVTEP